MRSPLSFFNSERETRFAIFPGPFWTMPASPLKKRSTQQSFVLQYGVFIQEHFLPITFPASFGMIFSALVFTNLILFSKSRIMMGFVIAFKMFL